MLERMVADPAGAGLARHILGVLRRRPVFGRHSWC
jgi:hypothetical protein